MKRSHCICCSLAEALLVSLACGLAHAQQGTADPAREAARLFAEARPHLQAVLGNTLNISPQFQRATAEQLRQLADPGLDVALLARFPDLRGAEFERARQTARLAKAQATVARLADGGDVLYVLPEQQPNIAHWHEFLETAESPAFLQLALVQEVVRGVLEKRYDLQRRRGACRDAEESLTLEALIAGRVLWVTQQVARRLGTESSFAALTERFRHVPDVATDVRLRALTQTALQQEYRNSMEGLEFFRYLEQQGSPDVERRVFTRPPRQLCWLESPQRFLRSEQQHRPGLGDMLAEIQREFTPRGWTAVQQPWTPAMVSQAAALFGVRERADMVLRTWDEGRSLLWIASDRSGRQIALSLVRHENAAGARSYFGLAVDLQRKRDELSGGETAGTTRVLDSRSSSLALPGVEEAVRVDKKMLFAGNGQPVSVTAFLGRAGDQVLEFSWYGLEPDAAWAESVVRAALAASAPNR